MKLIQRIGYYLGGFAIGLIILAFFFSKKKTSCSYGPEARVLKNINSKKLIYNENVLGMIKSYSIDSVEIKNVLRKGEIDFSRSEPRKSPCASYLVEGHTENGELFLTVENCDSTATVTHLKWSPGDN